MTKFKILLAEYRENWIGTLKDGIGIALREVGCLDDKYEINVFTTFRNARQALNESHWNLLITDLSFQNDNPSMANQLIGRQLIRLARSKNIPTIAITGSSDATLRHARDLLISNIYKVKDIFYKQDYDLEQFIADVKDIFQNGNDSNPIVFPSVSTTTYHIRVPDENSVRVQKWTLGQQQINQCVGTFNKNKLTDTIQSFSVSYLTLKDKPENIKKLGDTLFDALFDAELRNDFLSYYKNVVIDKMQKSRIVLEINEAAMPEIAAYPWEFLRIPYKYLQTPSWLATDPFLRFSRSRYNSLQEKPQYVQLENENKLNIALVVAKPTTRKSKTDPDLSNVEYHQIEDKLNQLAHEQERIELSSVINPATPRKVFSVLEIDQPDIFHFIGHGRLQKENGKEVGQIAFVKDSGEPDWKNADFFSILFARHRPKLVILQACNTGKESQLNAFSSVASHLILQGIPLVIAMQYEVSNNTANIFMETFYSEIAKGKSVDASVQEARFSIALEKGYDQPDFAIPVIYMNAVNARFD